MTKQAALKNALSAKLARMFYFIGCLTRQFILLIQRMKEADQHFKEFDKWIKKEIKRGKLKIK